MPLLPGGEEEIQAIVLQAGHQAYREYDFSRFPHCRVVLDGRRALCRERLEALGMRYVAIGDGYHDKFELGDVLDKSALSSERRKPIARIASIVRARPQ